MPPIPPTSPATGLPTPPSYIHTTSFSFVDTHGRTLLLRGVNLSGASKAPVGQLSHVLDGFWEGAGGGAGVGVGEGDEHEDEEGEGYWDSDADADADNISVSSSSTTTSSSSSSSASSTSSSSTRTSVNNNNNQNKENNTKNQNTTKKKTKKNLSFIGRPLILEDGSADVHLARLRGWGFNLLRFPFTWEGLEHEGPGKYDYEYMDYIIKCLVKCKEYGFRVYMDPHQDTWSRFSGGSGAPYWTLPACGINPRHITATQAALLHCEYPTPYRSSSSSSFPPASASRSSFSSPAASVNNLGEKPPSRSSPSSSRPSFFSPSSPNPLQDPSPETPQGPDPASLPAMSWSTNYGRLLSQTLFTLFFAGRDFAPKCVIDGVNIQDWLQERFLKACGELARRIGEWDEGVRERARAERRRTRVRKEGEGKEDDGNEEREDSEDSSEHEYPDTLLDACIIGWDSLNEPFEGLCGWTDLSSNPTEQGSTLKKGTYPTPVQSMRLGMGFSERVEHWAFGAMGPRRDGWVEVDPKGRKVWADAVAVGGGEGEGVGEGDNGDGDEEREGGKGRAIPGELPDGTHTLYGWKRDVSRWKLGTCIWAQHGVWDIPTGYLLRPDYFLYNPSTLREVEFLTDYWKPFFLAYSSSIRKYHKEAIVFVQPPVFAVPPRFSEDELMGRAAYSPHYYDGLTLVTRHWNWFNADALGLLRGKYRSSLGAVKIGEGAIRKSLHEQLEYLQGDIATFPPGSGGGGGDDDAGAGAGDDDDGDGDGEKEEGSPLGGKNTRGYPTVIGEIGTPFDMDGKRSYGWTDGGKYKGDYANQERALDASLQACDAWVDKKEKAEWDRERKEREKGRKPEGGGGNGGGGGRDDLSNVTLKGDSLNWTVWTYVPDDHTHEWGDGWNMEDLSLFSVDDLIYSDEEEEEDEEDELEEDEGEECCEECCSYWSDRERGEVDEDGGVVDAEERGRLGLGEEGVYREMHSLPRGRGRGCGRGRVCGHQHQTDEEALHSRAGLLMDGEREVDHVPELTVNGNQEESCGQRLRRCCQHHLHRRHRHHHHHTNTKKAPKAKDMTKSKTKSKPLQQQQPVKSLPMTAALSSLSVASLGSSTGLGLGAVDIHRRRGRRMIRDRGVPTQPITTANGNPSVLSVVSSAASVSTGTSSTRTHHRHHHHHQRHHQRHHHRQHHLPKSASVSTKSFRLRQSNDLSSIPPALLKAGYHPNPYTFLTNGARAVRAFARPWPVAVVGRAVDVRFEIAKGVFKLVVWVGWEDAVVPRRGGVNGEDRDKEKEEEVATEVYLPLVHYAHPRLLVEGWGNGVGVGQVQAGVDGTTDDVMRGGNGYGYPPGPVSSVPSLPHPQPMSTEAVTTANKDSLESSLATLAPSPPPPRTSTSASASASPQTPHDLPPLMMMTKTSTAETGTTLMVSSPPSPVHGPGPVLESPVKPTALQQLSTSAGLPLSAHARYPPHTTTRAPLLIRDEPLPSSSSSSSSTSPTSSGVPPPPPPSPPLPHPLIDVDVTLSSGRYAICGQRLLWWYDVPKKGEGRREYVLTVKRRGGALPSPQEMRARKMKERGREARGGAQGEGEGEGDEGCCESLCDEHGCVIA